MPGYLQGITITSVRRPTNIRIYFTVERDTMVDQHNASDRPIQGFREAHEYRIGDFVLFTAYGLIHTFTGRVTAVGTNTVVCQIGSEGVSSEIAYTKHEVDADNIRLIKRWA